MESGTPPEPHLDIILMSNEDYQLGDVVPIEVIGVFLRNDCDNKLVGVIPECNVADLSDLSDKENEDLHRLYPGKHMGEGWFGVKEAQTVVSEFFERYYK